MVLEKKIFEMSSMYFRCRYHLPLEKGVVLHLIKLESPSPKNALCQVWLKLVQCFWRTRFLNLINVFSLFCYHLHLEKGVALHLNNLNPFQTKMLCAKFGWNWPSGSREEDEYVKSLRQRRTTDKFRSEKLIWAFGSGELIKELILYYKSPPIIYTLTNSYHWIHWVHVVI